METALLQIKDHKAYAFLESLEDLNIIKLLRKDKTSQQKLSEKYAGKLPAKVANELQDYITKSRNEWDSRSI
ncbi:MAG: hypothetical protein LBQ31_10230 [Bacteroidales bacterium]|nr:hypothetical protein [Bacteroidales bacterium]